MTFIALRCAFCGTFQVKQVTKVPKFTCTICGNKQSVQKIYARSERASDCRGIVQQYNATRGAEEQSHIERDEESVDFVTARAVPDRGRPITPDHRHSYRQDVDDEDAAADPDDTSGGYSYRRDTFRRTRSLPSIIVPPGKHQAALVSWTVSDYDDPESSKPPIEESDSDLDADAADLESYDPDALDDTTFGNVKSTKPMNDADYDGDVDQQDGHEPDAEPPEDYNDAVSRGVIRRPVPCQVKRSMDTILAMFDDVEGTTTTSFGVRRGSHDDDDDDDDDDDSSDEHKCGPTLIVSHVSKRRRPADELHQ